LRANAEPVVPVSGIARAWLGSGAAWRAEDARHLNPGIVRPSRMLPGQRPGLAGQRAVRVFRGSLGVSS
jgi:hypothetical protein